MPNQDDQLALPIAIEHYPVGSDAMMVAAANKRRSVESALRIIEAQLDVLNEEAGFLSESDAIRLREAIASLAVLELLVNYRRDCIGPLSS